MSIGVLAAAAPFAGGGGNLLVSPFSSGFLDGGGGGPNGRVLGIEGDIVSGGLVTDAVSKRSPIQVKSCSCESVVLASLSPCGGGKVVPLLVGVAAGMDGCGGSFNSPEGAADGGGVVVELLEDDVVVVDLGESGLRPTSGGKSSVDFIFGVLLNGAPLDSELLLEDEEEVVSGVEVVVEVVKVVGTELLEDCLVVIERKSSPRCPL